MSFCNRLFIQYHTTITFIRFVNRYLYHKLNKMFSYWTNLIKILHANH
mgnify:CR=1 FL=1